MNIIKAHKTCYAHSPSITLKISSHGLIDTYEQFDFNYSTKHIISQKYFMNTIHVNSETLRLLFTANHPTSVPLCDPKNQSPFRPHSHHNIIYSINYTTSSPNSPWTVQTSSIIFTLRSQVLEPIKRSFKASNQPNHQKNT